jgi:hypothetical protein
MALGAALLGWLPFAGRPLSPDEAGYLLVGAQWGEGTSLYGDFWVDRPPGLIAIFEGADALGGTVALRLIGALAVLVSVILAGVLGRMAAPERRSAPLLTAGAAAAFVATPLFGGGVVNGEVLGLPFLLAGMTAYIASCASRSQRRALLLSLAAGAAAAAAALVKQSLIDVFLLVLVLVFTHGKARRRFPGFILGATVVVVAALAVSTFRGTAVLDLWEAVVTFRLDAARELASDSGKSTARLVGLLGALVASGLPLLAAAFAWKGRGAPSVQGPWTAPDLRVAAYVVLTVEAVVAGLGGSYWLHYLMGLVPGVVLLAAAFAQRPAPVTRSIGASFALAGISTAAVLGWVAGHPIDRPEEEAIAYLEDHATPGDTAVVVLGAANVIRDADLATPYPYLWSLPARVRDVDLVELDALLAGPSRPEWVVVARGSVNVWELSFADAQQSLDTDYARVAKAGKFTIYQRAGS